MTVSNLPIFPTTPFASFLGIPPTVPGQVPIFPRLPFGAPQFFPQAPFLPIQAPYSPQAWNSPQAWITNQLGIPVPVTTAAHPFFPMNPQVQAMSPMDNTKKSVIDDGSHNPSKGNDNP